MSTPKHQRPPRPTYTEGFRNGAVELYHTRRREHPNESHYAATVAVGGTMGVTSMSIGNWVKRAQSLAAATTVEQPVLAVVGQPAPLPSSDSALATLVEVLRTPAGDSAQGPAEGDAAAETADDDPQVTILKLRRQLAEAHRANVILTSATAYLASEALKAA